MTDNTANTNIRALLRTLPVLKGTAPEFDPARTPDSPIELFADWFEAAVRGGVVEPHAMTLSTIDPGGRPSGRVLILKDVDDSGWHFAINAGSAKGRDLAANPVAALTFYWPEQVRQVRVTGRVVADPADIAAADFLARPSGSRQMALTGRQSEPFTDTHELDDALEHAQAQLERNPELVPAEWISYAVIPETVEFWQGDPQRRHRRLRFQSTDSGWSRVLLWP